ncbi:MAG: Ig domain-containing protein [Lachnospiraceae bacterium]|nr:Ig domain-containing protein [Lachnospiraceae bacterium]
MRFFSSKRYRKKMRKIPVFFLLIMVLTVGLVGVKLGMSTQAAEDNSIWLESNNVKLGNEITLDGSTIYLQLKSSGQQYVSENYIIRWEILLDGNEIIGFYDHPNDKVMQNTGTEAFGCGIKAKKSGTAELLVSVLDKTNTSVGTASGGAIEGALQQISIKIKVVLGIDTFAFGESYQKVYTTDAEESLVFDDLTSIPVKLNIEDTKNAQVQCYSLDKDVVEIQTNENEGTFTAIAKGCGETTIYVRDKEGNTDSVHVYVMPKIARVEGGQYLRKDKVTIKNGDVLYSNACFQVDGSKVLQDKMVWVISKYNDKNQPVVIEDSLGNISSDLIEITRESVDRPANLKINAKAGQYLIELYPIGMYKNEKEKPIITPTTIDINVCANMDSREINLMVGDEFSVPNAINITTEDFNQWFTPSYGKGFGSGGYLTQANSEGVIRANKPTDQVIADYTVTYTAVNEYKEKVNALLPTPMNTPSVTFTFRVVDDLLLNMQSVSIVVGEEVTLFPSRQVETYDGGEYEWTSSNPKCVTVSKSGTIKGIAKTTEDVIITVALRLSDGTIKKATCRVKVEETIKNISLSDTNIELLEGNVKTITATFHPDRTEVPIQWMSSDTEVFSINISTDKKSVVVTAKKAGTAVLTALNEDNYVTAVCKITVLSQITKISLPVDQMTVKLNREVVRMAASCSPANASNNPLVWDSSDKSVATVDDSGLITLKKAGSTIITVKPLYNTSPPIMAQCILTVQQSSIGISLDKGSVTLEKGQTILLNSILKPTNATTTVAWKSMDTGIAIVNSSGLITAKKAGTTYIVVTSADGYSANCKVVVTQQAEKIKLSVVKLSLGVGNSYNVGTTITPKDATDKTVTWTSQDTSVAKVTSDGKITGVAVGNTVIAAKIKSGEVAYITVIVTDTLKGITLDQNKKTLQAGKSFLLNVIFKPENATNKKVKWSSSDTSVATVNGNGKVTGVKGGTAMITCKSDESGFTANCIVTVKELVTNVKLNKTSQKMTVGATTKLVATVSSNNASNKKVKWTTSNNKIATVNQSGKVTAKKLGSCRITVTATDGSGESASCSIRVIRRVKSLKINHSYLRLLEGKSAKIKTSISPSKATIKGIKWKSSDTNIAIVNSSGKVTAISAGMAKITASTTDGSKLVATCTVQVIKAVPVTSLTVSSQDITMVRGTSQSASVSISPSNTTDKITYSSDNKAVATVNSKGKITAKRPGVATITVTSSSGQQVCINVMVVGLNKTSLRLQQYDSDELWVEEVSENVKWSSSNPAIARVKNGTVVARKVGTATITATVRGVKLRCTVKVVKISK